MISKNTTNALNGQINAEIYSSYLYLSMSAYASSLALKGAANWFMVQAKEEMIHVQRIYDYVNSQNQRVILEAIDKPPADFDSLQQMFEETLKHEQKVTRLINDLVDLVIAEKDHATEIFLQWFVSEQVEEEEGVGDILGQLKLAGEHGGGLFMLDKELAKRVYTPPAQ